MVFEEGRFNLPLFRGLSRDSLKFDDVVSWTRDVSVVHAKIIG